MVREIPPEFNLCGMLKRSGLVTIVVVHAEICEIYRAGRGETICSASRFVPCTQKAHSRARAHVRCKYLPPIQVLSNVN